MAKYQVIQRFHDLELNKTFEIGDKFPANTKKARINDLLADDHEGRHEELKGSAIIEEVTEDIEEEAEKKEKE